MTRAHSALLATTLGVIAASAGCAPADQGESYLEMSDVGAYTEYVHPLLEGTCATLDCHGSRGRPLRLYSTTGLRIRDDLRTPAGVPEIPATDEELAANVRSIDAVDQDEVDVDARFVLSKPISDTGGGIHHHGGQIWYGRDDVAYRCVRAWLTGSIDVDACAEAKVRDALPPP